MGNAAGAKPVRCSIHKSCFMRTLRIPILAAIAVGVLAAPVAAKERWTQVRSQNFLLIGNASEKDIRKVGTRLEQFRETFRLVFGTMNLTSSIPTHVVVFKNSSSFKPFKPVRPDGRLDEFIAGYFQAGEDVNYIAISTEGDDRQTYGTIFHEYVHYIVNSNFGKSEVPVWFNEGLAEYYQTFEIVDDQRVRLGLAQGGHLQLLRMSRFIPLEELFNTRSTDLTLLSEHSRNIFYAQSWALMHYLIQGGKSEGLTKFLRAKMRNVRAEDAFREAFRKTYAEMELELRQYIGRDKYPLSEIMLPGKLLFDKQMLAQPLDDASMNAYLGDLLYHIRRDADAETYLVEALKLDPDSTLANTTLGMVKLRQRKFDDARRYLERGIAADPKNHLAYYQYAFLLSRESRDEFGLSQPLSPETATRMRDALRKAISLNPSFTESHDLLAYVALITNEGLDEALSAMRSAARIRPGNERYAMRIAEISMRSGNFDEAVPIAEKIARTTDDAELRRRAELLVRSIRDIQQLNARRAQENPEPEKVVPLALPGLKTDAPMTNEEIARFAAETRLRSINEQLRKAKPGEERTVGRIKRVNCGARPITFQVETQSGALTLSSRDFAGLELNTFVEAVKSIEVGCDGTLAQFNALLTYRPAANPRSAIRGDLTAIEFVPDDFRILGPDEMRQPPPRIVAAESVGPDGAALPGPRSPAPGDAEKRREAVLQAIRAALRTPATGEKREIGHLERVECTGRAVFFHLRTAGGTIKLGNRLPDGPDIRVFTPDLNGLTIGCLFSPVDYPTVFIYKDAPDARAKTAGTIVSFDFVPKSFVLD